MYTSIAETAGEHRTMDFDNPRACEVFFDIYEHIPRGGPGSTESTTRALAMAGELPAGARVLDLGCGPGRQTLVLAQRLPDTQIIAVDLHRPFLASLEAAVAARGFGDRVQAVHGDMGRLGFSPGSFDLIWCEGAAYFLGLENSFRLWRELLAEGGVAAFTEAVWRRSDPPTAVRRCWESEYPAMGDAEANLELLRRSGFEVLGHFELPEEDWWHDFYTPMAARIAELEPKYAGDAIAEEVLAESRSEIELFRNHSDCYGYDFFVARR